MVNIPPNITSFAPHSPINDTVGNWRHFNVTVNQKVNVSWYLNGTLQFMNVSVLEANCTLHAEVPGEHNVSAIASNANGTVMQTWIWNVTPKSASKPTSRHRSRGSPRDSDADSYGDIDEILAGTDPNDPCDPNPECAACLAIRPLIPTPSPKAIPKSTPKPTATHTIPPTVAPSPGPASTPMPTPMPGFKAVFAIAVLLAVVYLVPTGKRK